MRHFESSGKNCQPKLWNPIKLTNRSQGKVKAIIEQKLSFTTYRLSLTELLIYFWEKPQNKTQEEEEGYTSSEEQICGKHMDKPK